MFESSSDATLACALLVIILTITISYLFTQRQRYPFPVVNSYPHDFTQKRAHSEYNENAGELIRNGLAQHEGPITILTPNGPKIILPSSLVGLVKDNKDLDHVELVKDDFLFGYAGFEAQTAIHDPSHILVNVIKTKLSKNEANLPIINTHLAEALEQHWGDSNEWHAIDWQKDTTGLISRAAASVFVGPRLSKKQEWQDVTVDYVMQYFTALGSIRKWPAFLWPVAHLFDPHSRSCRQYMKQARSMVQEEILIREKERNDSSVTYNDTIEWITAIAGDRIVDHAALQLGFAVAALFTTSEALR